jgi:hypothetical protein
MAKIIKTQSTYKILVQKPLGKPGWEENIKMILGKQVTRVINGQKWLRIVSN